MDKKKTFGVSPKDQARLEIMGNDRVIADLAKKFPRSKPVEFEPSSMSQEDQTRLETMGHSNVMKHLNQRADELARELAQLPKHRETYQKQEIEAIIDVKKRLREFVDNFNRTTNNLVIGSPKYQTICEQYILQVTKYLDQETFWTYKFTTENGGGSRFDQPLECFADDSIYYMTQSGISLRLKRSISNQGLGDVIQPFFEKIIFNLANSKLKEKKPKIGTQVTEYRSDEFQNILKKGKVSGDFESPNEIYTKDGKIFFINSHGSNPHEGDRVNNILESR